MCGIYLAHRLDDLHYGMRSSSNRGEEAFGIAAIGDSIDVLKGVGSPDSFKLKTLHRIFNKPYHTFVGHVRYATTGRKEIEQILQDAHPISIDGKVHSREDHLVIEDCRIVGVHNGQVNDEYFGDFDFGELKTGTDTEKLLRFYDRKSEKEIMAQIPGAYTMIIADKGRNDMIIMRDRTGIKPGVLGKKAGSHVIASEDSALTDNKVQFIEELRPGWIYYMSPDGGKVKRVPVEGVEPSPKDCFFEWNYLARVESTLSDLQVRRLRRSLGILAAEEFTKQHDPDEIDFVTFVPEAPEESAIACAERLGKKHIDVFYKRDKKRAFLGSTNDERAASIKRNLQVAPGMEEVTKGKRLFVMEDSLVRGNNSKRTAHILNRICKAGPSYLVSYTPEIGIVPADRIPRGCMFGVDMPPEETENHSFIARGKSPEQISKEIGMDVFYVSKKGMLETFEKLGISRDYLCHYCIGGPHPFDGLEEKVNLSVGET